MRPQRCLILTAIILFVCAYGWCKETDISPANTNVHKQLERMVDLSGFNINTSFNDAIQILRNSVKPPLKIVVLWKDLAESADIYPNTPIYMDGISGVPLKKGLQLLLRSVSPRWVQLDYVIEDGIIIIATKEALPFRIITKVYDISDLTAPAATYYTSARLPRARGGYGFIDSNWDNQEAIAERTLQQRRQKANRIAQLIKDTISPDSWR